MKLECELLGEKYQKGSIATLSTHIGNLCPDVDEFIFSEGASPECEAERLAATIFQYGIPFSKKYDSIEKSLPEIYEKINGLGGYPERFAAALYLLERINELKEFIANTQKKYELTESQNVQTRFRDFSTQLLLKLSG
jgi:hypothetical protein